MAREQQKWSKSANTKVVSEAGIVSVERKLTPILQDQQGK